MVSWTYLGYIFGVLSGYYFKNIIRLLARVYLRYRRANHVARFTPGLNSCLRPYHRSIIGVFFEGLVADEWNVLNRDAITSVAGLLAITAAVPGTTFRAGRPSIFGKGPSVKI